MEHFIELVSREPCLYDTSHANYARKWFKENLWTKIAKETSFKNGQAAKDAWLKLRNCHRDAIRRRSRISTTVEATTSNGPKAWKYEKKMEFLLPYMNIRSTGDIPVDHSSQEPDSENVIQEIQFVATPRNDTLGMEVCSPHSTGNISAEVKERAEKRKIDYDSDDELQQFFNTMYKITKKMPALSQHKLKRKIFNLVSDEEEVLLTKATVTKCERGSPNEYIFYSEDE